MASLHHFTPFYWNNKLSGVVMTKPCTERQLVPSQQLLHKHAAVMNNISLSPDHSALKFRINTWPGWFSLSAVLFIINQEEFFSPPLCLIKVHHTTAEHGGTVLLQWCISILFANWSSCSCTTWSRPFFYASVILIGCHTFFHEHTPLMVFVFPLHKLKGD